MREKVKEGRVEGGRLQPREGRNIETRTRDEKVR
jgi:hypothetical protein